MSSLTVSTAPPAATVVAADCPVASTPTPPLHGKGMATSRRARLRNTRPPPSQCDNFMGRLATVMSNEHVRDFFADFFDTWFDTKAALMMLHVYGCIDVEYTKQTGERLTSTEIVEVMRQMFDNSECRHVLVTAMTEFLDLQNQSFLDVYRRVAPNQTLMWKAETK